MRSSEPRVGVAVVALVSRRSLASRAGFSRIDNRAATGALPLAPIRLS